MNKHNQLTAIFGSGFGLYGYLPAIIDGCKRNVVLPERYRNRFNERAELQRFACNVQWQKDDSTVLDNVQGVVLALTPELQSDWIIQCLNRSNIEYFLLEKPLAHSPQKALIIFEKLIYSRKVFRIGYTFRYTEWAKKLNYRLITSNENRALTFRWSFMAHHYKNNLKNWKRFNPVGGGAIRFYGIHFIAFLAEIGYSNINLSIAFGSQENEIEKWNAIFSGVGLPECEVTVDSKSSINEFNIELTSNVNSLSDNSFFEKLSDPFEIKNYVCKTELIDQRVPILNELCRSVWIESVQEYDRYAAILKLWLQVESKTQLKKL